MISSFMRPQVTARAPAPPPGPNGAVAPSMFHNAEVVPLPQMHGEADGAISGGFMAKFQVHFPQTGNDNPARRIISRPHTDALGWTWRLVLHPWGHDSRGCYSAFLELANAEALPPGFSRYVKLEFSLHGWDAAYQVQPIRTHFLLHKFSAQATDFGYNRAFEHDVIMAQRTKYIDPQGFVRMSVKITDVREAYFRVATDVDLARSVTGQGGGGDFADWRTCLPAKAFKHDQLLYVIQKVAELTGVSLVSCRPWLCLPRPGGAIRPVAALLPQHLPMTICEALGDRNQYHIYLEEVDSLPDVLERRRSVPGDLPPEVAGDLLLAGRAYAQLPSEVYLVFLKIERRILLAHANERRNPGTLEALPPSGGCGETQFVFIGKAMAHKSDRGSELIPIARSLAHLPETVDLEVFEQLAPEQVRRFSGDKTVAEAGLQHGSVLLFRGVPSPLPTNASSPPSSASAANADAPAAGAAAAAAVEPAKAPRGAGKAAVRAPPPSAAVGLLSLSSAIAAKTAGLVAIAPAPPSAVLVGPSVVTQETRTFSPSPCQGGGEGGGGCAGGGEQAAAGLEEGVEVISGVKQVLGEVKVGGDGEGRAAGRQAVAATGAEAFVPWAEAVAQRRTTCSVASAHREVNQEPARARLCEDQATNASALALTTTAAAKAELSKKIKEVGATARYTTTASSRDSSSSAPPSPLPEGMMVAQVDATAGAIDRTAGVGPRRTVSIAEALRKGAPPKGTETATPPIAAAAAASAGVSMYWQADTGDVTEVAPPAAVAAGPFRPPPEAIPTAPSRGAVSGEDTESDMEEAGEGAAPPEECPEERSDQQSGEQSDQRSEGRSDQRSEERSDQRSEERSNQRSEERSEERSERGIEPSERELEQPGLESESFERRIEPSEKDSEVEDSEEQLEQPDRRCEQQSEQQPEQQQSEQQQSEHHTERRETIEQGAHPTTLVTDHAGGRDSSPTPRCQKSASSSVTDHAAPRCHSSLSSVTDHAAGGRDSSPIPRCQSASSSDATAAFPQQQQQQQDSPAKRVTRARTGRTAAEEFEVSKAAKGTETGTARVETQQRRSSRKATPVLAAARAQTRYSTRAVSRGGSIRSRGGGLGACSARGHDGSISPARSASNSGGVGRASESSRSPRSRGDVTGTSRVKSSERDRDRAVNLKRAVEDGGEGRPRKHAKTTNTSKTINESEAQECDQFFVGIDAIAVWRQMNQVEGCNMDKILQLMRSAERIQIAKAIQSICSDGKDRWRANQLERLLTLRDNSGRDSTTEPN